MLATCASEPNAENLTRSKASQTNEDEVHPNLSPSSSSVEGGGATYAATSARRVLNS